MSNSITQEILLGAPLLNKAGIFYDVGPSLIVAPHPDDESLGCGGMIKLLRDQNVPVLVVFMTSGSASHHSKEFPQERLAQIREQEARNACEELGVANDAIFFLKQQDSQVPNIDEEKVRELGNQILEIFKTNNLKTIFLPWRRDPHGDHIATFNIVARAIETSGLELQVVEYPIWLWKNGKITDWPINENVHPFRLDISNVKDVKSKAVFAHKTQTTRIIADDPEGFILTENLLAPFMGDYEYYFFSKDQNAATLDKRYFDKLYTDNKDPWNFETSDYEKEKYEQTISALSDRKYKSAFEIGCSIGVLTQMLAGKCDKLLAVDISLLPIEKAKERCIGLNNVSFKAMDISEQFPDSSFDLILLSEVGYYLNKSTLNNLFSKIDQHLEDGGDFLMVHWTSYVGEYPLAGREVNLLFQSFNEKDLKFTMVKKHIHESYELFLWKKSS
ncbi:MAG: bifunctional PIG-L family deacetylase/class I SAM-dependent methyltransferase [Leeuwenhoekiella sp.]